MTATASKPETVVELLAKDLHGHGVVFCPNPKMALWSNHPRVFIDVAHTGEGARRLKPPGVTTYGPGGARFRRVEPARRAQARA